MKMELSECPEILQEEVKKYLSEHGDGKIICVSKNECTPYKDKTIILTTYTISVQEHNYFSIFIFMVDSIPDHLISGVIKNSMTAGEIIDIIKNAEGDYFSNI